MEWFQRHPSDYMKEIVSSSFQTNSFFNHIQYPQNERWQKTRIQGSNDISFCLPVG